MKGLTGLQGLPGCDGVKVTFFVVFQYIMLNTIMQNKKQGDLGPFGEAGRSGEPGKAGFPGLKGRKVELI